jgi:hypothetical protein
MDKKEMNKTNTNKEVKKKKIQIQILNANKILYHCASSPSVTFRRFFD